MNTNDEEIDLQRRLDDGTPLNPGDRDEIAYRRVVEAIRDVSPVLSVDFAARVVARARVVRVRSSSLSLLLPLISGTIGLALSAGVMQLLVGLGYLDSSPLGALTTLSGTPPALAAAACALATLAGVDAILAEFSRE